jgi:hypothetical protein
VNAISFTMITTLIQENVSFAMKFINLNAKDAKDSFPTETLQNMTKGKKFFLSHMIFFFIFLKLRCEEKMIRNAEKKKITKKNQQKKIPKKKKIHLKKKKIKELKTHEYNSLELRLAHIKSSEGTIYYSKKEIIKKFNYNKKDKFEKEL